MAQNDNERIAQALDRLRALDFRRGAPLPAGLIGEAADQLRERLGRVLSRTALVVTDFRGATRNLGTLSNELLEGAIAAGEEAKAATASTDALSESLTIVSAASEELSINMKSIAENARHSQDNVRAVADAGGELAVAAQEIARASERARGATQRAVGEVAGARRQIDELESVAGEIGKITGTISDISSQTRLLALNATIEAARAGDAGRGFAVVAAEVKDLALQTREATRFITGRVGAIQAAVAESATAIGGIHALISELSDIVASIAAAAEEQSITTRDISGNIHDATGRLGEVYRSVDEGAKAVEDVNRHIAAAAVRARESADSVRRIAANAGNLTSGATVSYAHAIEVGEHADALSREFAAVSADPEAAGALEPGVMFRFSPYFSVLVEHMDTDHRRIFEFVNRIHATIKTRAPREQQVSLFREMGAFTAEHFAREEELMLRHSYPGYDAQKRAHEKLLGTVREYADQLATGAPVNLIAALAFLTDWLKSHILEMDRQYGDYFRERGIAV